MAGSSVHSCWASGGTLRRCLLLGLSLALSACTTQLPDTPPQDGRHLGSSSEAESPEGAVSGIPSVVGTTPLLSAPQPGAEPELFTIVAQDVPLRDLLFTMARDAGINVDVHPDVQGVITLNAINQTLPQILQRIARQADIRWSFDESNNLVVEGDTPFWRTYTVDYVNVSRSAESQAQISTAIVANLGDQAGGGGQAGGGAGGINNSQTSLTQSFANNFWTTLTANLRSLLGEAEGGESVASGIVSNPETGLLSVRATSAQHQEISAFINSVQSRSLHQVLIEATIVEVSLNDEYQSGVDWDTLGGGANTEVYFAQNILAGGLSTAPFNVLTIDRSTASDPIRATIRALSTFGELRVLSSPKIMTLNNQAAMLRVVDNEVYFSVEVTPPVVGGQQSTGPTFNTVINTVPVGFVMTVTPQVSNDNQVTLNVRPTISRIVGYEADPNPIFATTDIDNLVPRIQVREFESILKVYDGQIAILGGLMEDSVRNNTEGLPVLSRVPGLRSLFSYRDDVASKTELIIFIRPVVVRDTSLSGDLSDYRQFLPVDGLGSDSALSPEELLSP